jgi:hypothetical protein
VYKSGRLTSKPLRKNLRFHTKSIILPALLYGCETWSVTLREKHTLRVFENKVRRRISGPKREEMGGGWRKYHNEELRNLYTSSKTILR